LVSGESPVHPQASSRREPLLDSFQVLAFHGGCPSPFPFVLDLLVARLSVCGCEVPVFRLLRQVDRIFPEKVCRFTIAWPGLAEKFLIACIAD
jgi:hypothetical protein